MLETPLLISFFTRDINGDGRADLIWVDQVKSGAQVWYNEGPSGDAPGDEATGVSAFRWRYGGDSKLNLYPNASIPKRSVCYSANISNIPIATLRTDLLAVAHGSSGRGSCIEFANINGLGRADYVLVYPVTNRAFAEL